MKVLVINCGSSSIKYRIIDVGHFSVIAQGILEEIGASTGRLSHHRVDASGETKEIDVEKPVADHREGFEWIMSVISETGSMGRGGRLLGIGHRIVHGGERFHAPVLIDDNVLDAIRGMIPLAPLHNPANILGVEILLKLYPATPQVAVFDTAFHRTMPPCAYRYAMPPEFYGKHLIRRYGFHGISHYYIAKAAAAYLGKPLEELNLITLHLGNGTSATAIRAGKSVDTSMGMTPLEGLIMGTRSGDLDPAILIHLGRTAGMSHDDLEQLLNHECGLKGLCGTNDMREILRLAEAGNTRAGLAVDMYCYRIKKYIGAYFAVLGRVDALVFTGGIGENAARIRRLSCEGLERMGILLDDTKNELSLEATREIQDGDGVKVLVIPAGEEIEIARRTVECVRRGMNVEAGSAGDTATPEGGDDDYRSGT